MLLHLEQPYVAVLVCTGDTHIEPVILGFPDQKGKKLSPADVEIGLRAIALEHGWLNEPDRCPRCGVAIRKLKLGRLKQEFERPDNTEEELLELERTIDELEAYLGKFDPDRKKEQPDLPFDAEDERPDEERAPGDEPEQELEEEPESDEAAVGASDDH